MWNWVLQVALDSVVPILLTLALGVLGVKLKHIKDALDVITDAIADGKIDKNEWKDIRAKVKAIIGR